MKQPPPTARARHPYQHPPNTTPSVLLALVAGSLALWLPSGASEAWKPLPKQGSGGERATATKGGQALTQAPAQERRKAPEVKPKPVFVTYNTVEASETPKAEPPAPGTPSNAGAAAPASVTAAPAPSPTAAPAAPDAKEPAAVEAKDKEAEATTPAPAPNPVTPHVGGKTLYSFKAENLELKAALAIFARANKLNIVPDQEVTGQVTLDIEDLPLDRVMQALLEAHDYSWLSEDGLIRVRARETKEFQVDYLRLSRKGMGMSSAMLASGMSGGSGGSGGGGGATSGGSSVNLTADNSINFWVELKQEIDKLASPSGRETIAINQTAGLIQISDRPSALKRIERYLASMSASIARQVEIHARIYDVTLRDQFQFGIDWDHAASSFGSAMGVPTALPNGGKITLGGKPSVTSPSGGFDMRSDAISFLFKDANTSVLIKALNEQGNVNVVSQPRVRVVNNQTAMIKVGTETPFFTRRSLFIPGQTAGTTTQTQEDEVTTITVGTILAITPQISQDEWITLDIAPVLSSLVETKVSPSELTTAPVLDIKQASTLVRVKAGTTIVIGGLMQDERAKSTRSIPLLGDIPLLGKLFQGRVDFKAKKELVISITPTIVQ